MDDRQAVSSDEFHESHFLNFRYVCSMNEIGSYSARRQTAPLSFGPGFRPLIGQREAWLCRSTTEVSRSQPSFSSFNV